MKYDIFTEAATDGSPRIANTLQQKSLAYSRQQAVQLAVLDRSILELFSREIICYSLSKRLSAKCTVVAALDMAVKHRRSPEGIILH